MAANQLCENIHGILANLPVYRTPGAVPFRDGLYFFYEEGEIRNDQSPRIVRVGNHPRSIGRLVARLRAHYSGNKNGSAFRKLLGGALLRRENPNCACLKPAPGKGHWEKQDAPRCLECQPVEQRVSEVLRRLFFFRCVSIPELSERNQLEARLIATLAACNECGPSASWLGLHAYSPTVCNSGLWNIEFIGNEIISQDDLNRFRVLVERTAGAESI
jgi:hypothetical protein